MHHLQLAELLPGDQSVHREACEFQRAHVVFGAHGAALANLVFCTPNTSVVEVGYRKDPIGIYFDQARFLHLAYFALVAQMGSYGSPLTITDAQVHCVMDAIFHKTSCNINGTQIA